MSRLATHHGGGVIVLLAMLSGVEGLGYLLTQTEAHLPLWSLIIPPVLFLITMFAPGDPDRIEAKHRLEQAFGEKIEFSVLSRPDCPEAEANLTVGELHDRICCQLHEHGKPIPCSSWHRVQHALAEATGCPPHCVCRKDSLRKVLHHP
jgi:hypothetical protein